LKTLQEELKDYVNKLIDGKQLSLVNIKGGAAIELFDLALADVIRNCADINTTLTAREVILKVKVVPSKDRDMVGFKIEVGKKLAGGEAIEGAANVEVDAGGKGWVAIRRPEQRQTGIFNTNVTKIGGNE